jgi:hypothetical protein
MSYGRRLENNFYFSDIEAECQDDFMKIRVGFNGSFAGLVYSAGKSNVLLTVINLYIKKN